MDRRRPVKLYYTPGSCALACWIAFEWAGADYSVEEVDPQSASYRAINPLGMVPTLNDGSRILTQADAILVYIADRYYEGHLGAGFEAEQEFAEVMAFLTGDMHPAYWPFFAPERFTTDHSQSGLLAVRDAVPARIARVLTHLDGLIGDSWHVHDDRRTVADAYAFVMARWSDEVGVRWSEYPRLAGFMANMQQDEAVRRVLTRSGTPMVEPEALAA